MKCFTVITLLMLFFCGCSSGSYSGGSISSNSGNASKRVSVSRFVELGESQNDINTTSYLKFLGVKGGNVFIEYHYIPFLDPKDLVSSSLGGRSYHWEKKTFYCPVSEFSLDIQKKLLDGENPWLKKEVFKEPVVFESIRDASQAEEDVKNGRAIIYCTGSPMDSEYRELVGIAEDEMKLIEGIPNVYMGVVSSNKYFLLVLYNAAVVRALRENG